MSDRATGDSAEMTRADALRALEWLRDQHPTARMTTVLNPSDDAFVAVRVQIETADGPAGGAHGVALSVEDAEDRAIVRAAEALGYRHEEPAQAAAPTASPPAEPRAVTSEPPAPPADPPARPQPQSQAPQPAPTEPPARPQGQQPAPLAGRAAQMGPPVMVRPRQPAPQPPARPAQARGGLRPVPDLPESDARLEDVSWTEFWKWARARGFDSRDAVNEAIQRPMDGMTPREVRDLLKTYLGEEE
jgi:hypothetical protein